MMALNASTGDVLVSIRVRSDDTMTYLQSPLVTATHSPPGHSALDDPDSVPFDMLPAEVEDSGAPSGRTLCTSSIFSSR